MIDFEFLESDVEKVNFIKSIGVLIQDGEITPSAINEALGNQFAITKYLNVIYSSVLNEYNDLILEYKIWYAEKSQESQDRLSLDMPKSKTISDTKIEQDVIVHNKDEYRMWQNKINAKRTSKEFYETLKDSWKTNSKVLIEISQNMRTELMTLRIEDRANKDIKNEALIRHTSISDEVPKSLKKIKKIV